jgi:hypothetical protein
MGIDGGGASHKAGKNNCAREGIETHETQLTTGDQSR